MLFCIASSGTPGLGVTMGVTKRTSSTPLTLTHGSCGVTRFQKWKDKSPNQLADMVGIIKWFGVAIFKILTVHKDRILKYLLE